MTVENALESLRQFMARSRVVNVVVGSRVEEDEVTEYIFERLQLQEDVADEFRAVAHEFVQGLAGVVLVPYDALYKPDAHEILWLSLDENEGLQEIAEAILDVSNLAIFEENEEVVENLKFYSIVAGTGDKKALFFRIYGPKKELSRTKLFGLVWKRGSFNKVTDKLFLFDREIDCFAWQSYMFIVRPNSFQRMFQYFEQLRAQANVTLNTVLQRIPVANAAEFQEVVRKHTLMLAKVTSIARKPYLGQVTMVDIERTIQHFGLDVEVQDMGGGQRQLVFDPSPAKRWRILKLLDDDYLGSVMTQAKYAVNSKIPMG